MTKPVVDDSKSLGEKIAVLVLVVVPLVATVYAIASLWQTYVDTLDIVLLLVFYSIGAFGITVGFHRLLTHKSFETYAPVKALLLIMGCTAIEGNPMSWGSYHIQHHAHSDGEDDPHSPLKSFWHAHVGWMFEKSPDYERYGSWMRKDPVIVWVDKTWLIWASLGLIIPFAIGGWSGLLWGGLVRLFLNHHVTWSVNSVCHTFGSRTYDTKDASRNNWLIGLLAFGEGWHNNHHAFPRAAFHGMRWWQVDFSSYLIRAMEATGLAWKVYRVKPEDERRRYGVVHGKRVPMLAPERKVDTAVVPDA